MNLKRGKKKRFFISSARERRQRTGYFTRPLEGRVQPAKIPFQIAARWDFRRKTRVFREKTLLRIVAKNASNFVPV
jgi:hypothetical protein